MKGVRWMRKRSSNLRQKNSTKYKVNMTCYDEETRYRPMHDKDSKGVWKRWLCAMHEKCTCEVRCIKYTTNEPTMSLMRKHEKPQSLVLIGVQTREKMSKRHFVKHLACTLWTIIWNNAWILWNPPLIHVLFATRGQHPMQINKRNQSHEKKFDKN